MLDYQPKDSDVFLRVEGQGFERRIFHEPIELLDSEHIHLKNFHDYLAQTKQVLPEKYINDPSR